MATAPLQITVTHRNGQPSWYTVFGSYATQQERDAALAVYPKSLRLSATTIDSTEGTRYGIAAETRLEANGANGGKNETGIKRLRRLLELLEYHTPYTNSYPTAAAALEAIDG